MALSNLFGATKSSPLPVPAVELPADKSAKPGELHSITLAGGCFWCVEGVFRQLDGVTSAVSGYAGGSRSTADYESVCSGVTGHAEAVKVTYDPAKISFAKLIRVLFTVIDPTTLNRQGPDSGTQYRSAIFYENEDQKKVAQAYIDQVNAAKVFPRPIVTSVEAITPDTFYPAEAYHQNYVACHLNNPYIQYEALPKVDKVRKAFPDAIKPATQPAQ